MKGLREPDRSRAERHVELQLVHRDLRRGAASDERNRDGEGKSLPPPPRIARRAGIHDCLARRYGATSVNFTSRLYVPGTSCRNWYVVL